MRKPKIKITLVDRIGKCGCSRGHKIGDAFDYDTDRGKLCPMAMHVAFPYIDILFGIRLQSTAEKLCQDYGLSSGNPPQIQPRPNIRKFREDELLCIHTLGAYRTLLEKWKDRYAPQPDSDIWDLRLCEA